MRSESRGILSPVRLPIPPLQQRDYSFYHVGTCVKSPKRGRENLRLLSGKAGSSKFTGFSTPAWPFSPQNAS